MIIVLIIAFIFGSIPSGYILTKKYYGIDIRTQGSGNIGSTNVKRIVGKKVATMTQVMDIVKGVIPIIIGIFVSQYISLPFTINTFLSIIAIVVILGHDYTPFLGFNGGKGVNTTIGAFALIAFIPTLSGVIIYFLLKYVTDIVSIRSLALGLTIPVLSLILGLDKAIVISSFIAWIIMVYRHKDNIKRLIRKEEK